MHKLLAILTHLLMVAALICTAFMLATDNHATLARTGWGGVGMGCLALVLQKVNSKPKEP
jgi:hypothetical protein